MLDCLRQWGARQIVLHGVAVKNEDADSKLPYGQEDQGGGRHLLREGQVIRQSDEWEGHDSNEGKYVEQDGREDTDPPYPPKEQDRQDEEAQRGPKYDPSAKVKRCLVHVQQKAEPRHHSSR